MIKPPVCAVVASALVNRYPIPTIVGYKGEGEYDAKKAHIAKLRATKRYLYSPAGAEKDDLVIIMDGFDVLAQIPVEIVIERYFDLIAEADQKLADQRGITVEEVHSRGLRHTLLWGTDKGCFPTGGEDPRCWLRFSISQSGTVIGPLGDLRIFIDATLQLIKDTWDPDFKFHNSDQYSISTLYARQEYQRTLDLNDGEFPGDIGGRKLPRRKKDENDVTEYHLLVDFGYSITQTQCHNDRFMRKLQYKNHDLTATVAEDALEEGENFRPYNIQMPSSLYQAMSRLYDSLLGDERPSMSAKEWVRSLRLGTNIGTGNIYAFYHNTCSKKAFVDKYHDS
ncbi:hypothetical protein H9L39_19024 [Fusarium oxysporum f. sp. albedinis]|nr:hypothetical protein H9L39_19024 [Fusarium oxysporum f. sp. albedinis]